MHLIVPYVPSWMRRVAVVQTCHGINPNEYWSSLKDELYWRPTLSLGAKFSDRIICMSDDCRQVMRKRYGFPLERMDVGYLGLNKSLKRMNKKERENAKRYLQKKYNLPDKNFILYVGGTLKNKNLNTAFNTWFILRSKYNFNLPLIITRIDNKDIPYMTALGNGCTIRPGKDIIGISWIEKEEDLNLFYNCATFTIYPSLFEGLGYPICESMKCGTPVITSNISAMPEAAGGAALLVNNPKNPKEWANAIWNLYNNKRLQKKLVRLGLKRAKRFTWSKIADSAIESYKKAISDKKTKRI
jgi:glycosyltransferase involved in cell wall biosynthesis